MCGAVPGLGWRHRGCLQGMTMLLIAAQFLTGRVHATPWGHHVNEGLVEWPPSPWRILRAILSAGFTRLGWTKVPEDGHALMTALAQSAPTFHLPRATLGHTRHYVPLYDGKTTRIIDAFAHVGGPLVVELAADLDAAQLDLLDRLLALVPYLGRAESRVVMRRVAGLPRDLLACSPGDAAPTPQHEGVALLAPEPPLAFHAWREAARKDVVASVTARTREKGKQLTKKELSKGEAGLPVDVVQALLVATPDLQREGWSQPPGSRWLSYWRPPGALQARPHAIAASRQHGSERIDTALLALSSDTVRTDVLPPMPDALRRLEAIHQTLVRESDRRGAGPSPCFTGSVRGDRIKGHRHATLIPLTLGKRKGRIDHVLVHAPMGFNAEPGDDRAIHALGAIRRTYAKNLPTVFVVVAGMGKLADFENAVPLVRPSRAFRSITPFVPPRYLKAKGKDGLLGQVQAELCSRGLPPPLQVELETRASEWTLLDAAEAPSPPWPRFRGYRYCRASRPPPAAIHFSLRLVFEHAVRGPIALGYGSHFGLGVFEPEL
ncbi:MAG: type I-G CRISPR-associated protein Csb2 [Polyangiaceae bacterium]